MSRSSKSKANNAKTYIETSIIANAGKGLYARVKINKGSIIEEYKGRLRRPDERPTSNRSNIYFNDEHYLECYDNDLASYANDPVELPQRRRKLIESLNSDKPFYSKHPKAVINAEIKINDKLHRAFLMATEDIEPDEEIFSHYGFTYWFKKEITTMGFEQEAEIEENGFPERLFEYPAFLQYVKLMYPRYVRHESYEYGNGYDFMIHMDGGGGVNTHIDNFARMITRIPKAQAKRIIAENMNNI